jgi:hypothetical protein
MPRIIHDQPAGTDQNIARQQAIRRLERKRRFWISTVWSAVGMLVLVVIWAVT